MISFKQLGQLGRIGNKLFQLSATIALALRNNDKYVFPYWEEQPFFNLKNCFSDQIQNTNVFNENGFAYKPIPYTPNTDLVGFFQSEKYFEDYKNVIISLLTPKIGYGIQYDQASIHVRRGDYLSLPNAYNQLGMPYYNAAMEVVKAKRYMVFSDDINWCKTHFIGPQFVFSEGNSPVVDLSYMISCEHNIIGNSSFSWWGAYLNKNPYKMIVAPKTWFGPKLPHDTKDLLPKEWIQIE